MTNKNSALSIKELSKKSGGKCELAFGDGLTIDTISPQLEAIYQSLEKYSTIVITSQTTITNIDLGGLQTLMFIYKYCEIQNKSLEIDIELDENRNALLQHAGAEFLIRKNP